MIGFGRFGQLQLHYKIMIHIELIDFPELRAPYIQRAFVGYLGGENVKVRVPKDVCLSSGWDGPIVKAYLVSAEENARVRAAVESVIAAFPDLPEVGLNICKPEYFDVIRMPSAVVTDSIPVPAVPVLVVADTVAEMPLQPMDQPS